MGTSPSLNEAAAQCGNGRQLITLKNTQRVQVAAAAQCGNVRQLPAPIKIQRVQVAAASQS